MYIAKRQLKVNYYNSYHGHNITSTQIYLIQLYLCFSHSLLCTFYQLCTFHRTLYLSQYSTSSTSISYLLLVLHFPQGFTLSTSSALSTELHTIPILHLPQCSTLSTFILHILQCSALFTFILHLSQCSALSTSTLYELPCVCLHLPHTSLFFSTLLCTFILLSNSTLSVILFLSLKLSSHLLKFSILQPTLDSNSTLFLDHPRSLSLSCFL